MTGMRTIWPGTGRTVSARMDAWLLSRHEGQSVGSSLSSATSWSATCGRLSVAVSPVLEEAAITPSIVDVHALRQQAGDQIS